jgi:hypothetical protein
MLKIANSAYGTLAASINSSATTIVLDAGQGARFPTFNTGDVGYTTLSDSSNNLEIVKVTARSGDTFTVERGQDGTTARAYAAGDRMDMRPVAACFTSLLDVATAEASYATTAFVGTAVASKLDATTANATYAKLAGGNTISGTQKLAVTHWKLSALGSISGPVTIDLAIASTYSMTLTGTTTLSFINAPAAGYDATVYLKMRNAGAHTINWPAGTRFPGGLALGLTTVGYDLLALWYDQEAGAWVVSVVFKDYKVL